MHLKLPRILFEPFSRKGKAFTYTQTFASGLTPCRSMTVLQS